jgi:Ni/Co efflux regulator RcnB
VALVSKLSFFTALALVAAGITTAASAQERGGEHAPQADHGAQAEHSAHGTRPARPAVHGEAHAGPTKYQRVAEPSGWNNRPAQIDKTNYQHNYQAARSYHVGVYHRPPGWVSHRWGYGQILPRAYWAAPFILADYWLFALEVPPVGFEWVRDDTDAILVNVATGQIIQVEYGVFG